jgi:hypothetical protein
MSRSLSEKQRFNKLIVLATLTKLSDILISAKTTLPWLLSSIGGPSWVISVLVPIRESGALIPQWPVKQGTSDIRNRLILWRWGIVAQAFSIAVMIPAVAILSAYWAGLCVLLALAMMSLGRSLCSLTMKDIQGYNVSKGERGKLNGIATTVSGVLSLTTAALLLLGEASLGVNALLAMVAVSALLFMVTLPFSVGLDTRLEKQSGDQGISSLINTLQDDIALKHLVASRCLMLHGALVAPFFVSQSVAQNDAVFALPYFIGASAMASFLSSYLWGLLSDDSAVLSLRLGSVICVFSCIGVLVLPIWNGWTPIIMFFLLNLGYAGIRNGRKTYVIDIAEDDTRTQYVAVGNSLVGFALLLLGGLYAAVTILLGDHIISIMAAAMALGTIHTYWLKKEK